MDLNGSIFLNFKLVCAITRPGFELGSPQNVHLGTLLNCIEDWVDWVPMGTDALVLYKHIGGAI